MTIDQDAKIVSVSRVVDAPADEIFEILADPAKHHLIDGSDMVRAPTGQPGRLKLGDRFGMNMRLGVPYRISNEVVEFEEGRVIAWRHFGHHIWRYQLDPIPGEPNRTEVTESFNWGAARFPAVFYELAGYPKQHDQNIARTLERLAELVER